MYLAGDGLMLTYVEQSMIENRPCGTNGRNHNGRLLTKIQ